MAVDGAARSGEARARDSAVTGRSQVSGRELDSDVFLDLCCQTR